MESKLTRTDIEFINSGLRSGRIFKRLILHEDRVFIFHCEDTADSRVVWSVDGFHFGIAVPRKAKFANVRNDVYIPMIRDFMDRITCECQ